ncbi:hypothetical protein OKA04_15735 [Luteolibacter flavescens]|uniref:ECF transporter S component n=1 Tax=Luteolibacter flavescens TaxID=1859460 RepID=A0ABT3FSL5_9BACT|nr:hypothetical protein [Luteolibacter flavescens]MCW1886189.1 hypothetical protein [Luteolibacter flavescens]
MIRRLLQPQADLLDDPTPGKIARIAGLAALSLAAYGFTTGYWRSPVMGLYVAVKMPLLVACTLCCNGILNGLLGILLGGLGFRQSLLALLSAFAASALMLGSLAPVTLMLALDAPPPDSPQAGAAHSGYLLFHVFLVALAGIAGTLTLHRILRQRCPSPGVATLTMLAWLAGNGFLGAQFSWILRPFFGSPRLEVAFFRPDPMNGSFYEAVWLALDRSTGGNAALAIAGLLAALALIAWPVVRTLHPRNQSPTRNLTETTTRP